MSNKIKLFWDNVAAFKFHYWWLVIVATAIHRMPFLIFSQSEALLFKKIAMFITCLLMIFVMLKNFKLWAFRIMLIGILLNFAAISFNGGLMPVTPEARINAGMSSIDRSVVGGVLPEGSGVLLTADQTRLWLFTDIIPVEKLGAVCSIGDLIILFGMVVLGIQIVYRSYPRNVIHQDCAVNKPTNILKEKT